MWWIRAAIQEYILRSWSLVKIGTTVAQKKLFFGLNKAKKRISAFDAQELRPDEVKKISEDLDVPDYEVIDMNRRMGGGDVSLNAPLTVHEDSSSSLMDTLADGNDNQEVRIEEYQEKQYRTKLLYDALGQMNEREQYIIKARKMTDPPVILERLSEKFNVSRERIRQIEAHAYKKLKDNVQKLIEYRKPKLLKQKII